MTEPVRRLPDTPVPAKPMNARNTARVHRAAMALNEAIRELEGLPPGPSKAVLIQELQKVRRGIYHALPEDYPKGP